jgi:hypothetical protein
MYRLFDCFIPDDVFTPFEKLESAVTLGTFRGIYRKAWAEVDEKYVKIAVQDSQRNESDVDSIPIQEIKCVQFEKIPVKTQMRATIFKSLITGLVIGVCLSILIFLRVSKPENVSLITIIAMVVGLGLLGGQIIALLFSFIPNLIRLKRNLLLLKLCNSEGLYPFIAVRLKTKDEVIEILSKAGLKIE